MFKPFLNACVATMAIGASTFGYGETDEDFENFSLEPSTTQEVIEDPGKSVPEGHVGYVIRKPSLLGWFFLDKGGFLKVVQGPINFGFTQYSLKIVPVDVRINTYSEPFIVLTSDRQKVAFNVHAQLRVKDSEQSTIVDVVENYGGQHWYWRFIQEPFRTMVREATTGFDGFALATKEVRDQVTREITEALTAKLEGTPFRLEGVSVGNIQYSRRVVDEIENTIAREQEEVRKAIEARIAEKDKEIAIIRAQSQAEAQRIRSETLNELILSQDFIEALKQLAASDNAKVVFVPVGGNGGPTQVLDIEQLLNSVSQGDQEDNG